MTEYRVSSIMRRDTQPLTPDMPIRRAVAQLVENRSAAAAVVDTDGQLIGILTQKDCFKPALHASYYREWTGCVADRMTSPAVSVDIEDEVMGVAEMFLNYPHRVFPACEAGVYAGLVNRSDVLALLLRLG